MANLAVPISDTTIVEGQTDHPGLHSEERDYIETLRNAVNSMSGTSTLGDFGRVSLDSFAGATDDAKLTAALTATAGDTYPRGIQLTNRLYTFTTANRLPFEGMKIFGPDGHSNPERGSGTSSAGEINLNFAGAWFAPTATVFQTTFQSLTFVGGSGAWVIGGTGVWYQLRMRDIYATGLRSVIGSIATKALFTAVCLDGDWEINNCVDLFLHAGGSDNKFLWSCCLVDSNVSNVGSGQAHLWYDGMDKTPTSGLYITAEQDWSAIRVTGNAYGSSSNNEGGPLDFYSAIIEGRNEGAPSYGALVRVEGGSAIFHGAAFNFAMSDPSNAGLGRTDQAVIEHTGGQLIVDSCTYDRATGVAETVPFVRAASNGDCHINRILRSERGGLWTGRPRYLDTGTGTVFADASVTVI